jgi:phage nucleotide-binding protein
VSINLKNTSNLSSTNINMLIYGQAGAGKTSLIPSLPAPLILSAEGGLLSIVRKDIEYIEIDSVSQVREVLDWINKSEEARHFESIAIDSITEIAHLCLSNQKEICSDPRQAYGELQEIIGALIREFRDLDKHVVAICNLDKTTDEMGRVLYGPSMPGQKLAQSIPYLFDLILAMRVEKDAEGEPQRALMSASDGLWQAKDRSGRLDAWMAPDLTAIFKTVLGEHNSRV